MYKLCKIILLLVSIQILAGCVDRHGNTGLEVQNKIIKIPTNLLDLDLYSFNSILYGNYPDRITIQAPKNINGWSIMAPEVVNIIYEKEDIYKNIGLDNVDIKDIKNVDDADDGTIPTPKNPSDQYADDSNANLNQDSEDNPDHSFDE